MASLIYPKYKQNLLAGDASSVINTGSPNVKGILVSSGYTYSTAHTNRSDVTSTFVGQNSVPAAVEPSLSGTLTLTDGAFKCTSALTFTAVASNNSNSADRVILFTSGGANDRLMCIVDLPSVVNFNGGNVVVTWSTSPDYIFQL